MQTGTTIALSFLIDDRQLMFFSKVKHTDNTVLQTVTCLPIITHAILGLAAEYEGSDVRKGLHTSRDVLWSCFVSLQRV